MREQFEKKTCETLSSNFAKKCMKKCKNEAKHVAKFAKQDEQHAEVLQKQKKR